MHINYSTKHNKNQIYDKDAQVYLSQIKKYKPNKIEEYLDLSQVYYEINGFDSALKILDKGIKKYPQEPMLYTQKIKFYYLENNQEKIQETLSIMEEIFK